MHTIDQIKREILRLMNHLPDSDKYKYAWDECTGEEQEAVKMVRQRARSFLDSLNGL